MREARASIPRRKPAVLTAFRPSSGRPIVTYSIIALCVLVYLLQVFVGSAVTQALVYYPPFTYAQPWRMITSMFAHSPSSILHVLFNMYTLFVFGPILERLLGRGRFLALYLISGFGGSVAVLWLTPTTPVLGASGAIFGLLGAFFVIQRKLGGNNIQLLILIGINLVIGFLPGLNISWQAHVGGLIAGSAVAFVFVRTRRADQRGIQILLVAAIVVVLIALTVARAFIG